MYQIKIRFLSPIIISLSLLSMELAAVCIQEGFDHPSDISPRVTPAFSYTAPRPGDDLSSNFPTDRYSAIMSKHGPYGNVYGPIREPYGIALDDDHKRLFVAEKNGIAVVERAGDSELQEWTVRERLQIGRTVSVTYFHNSETGKTTLYAMLPNSNEVAVFDLTGNIQDTSKIRKIKVGRNPSASWLSSDRKYIYVSNSDIRGNSISRISTTTDKVEPFLNFSSVSLQLPKVDAAVKRAQKTPKKLTRKPAQSSVQQSMQNLPAVTGDTLPVGALPGMGACTVDSKYILIPCFGDNSVSVLDARTYGEVNNISVGSSPTCIAVDPNRNFAYVANFKSDSVSVIDLDSLDAAPKTIQLPVGSHPNYVALNTSGKGETYLFVSCRDRGEIAVIDCRTNNTMGAIALPVMELKGDACPTGNPFFIAFDGNNMFVSLYYQRQVVILDWVRSLYAIESDKIFSIVNSLLSVPVLVTLVGLILWFVALVLVLRVDPLCLFLLRESLSKIFVIPGLPSGQKIAFANSFLLKLADHSSVLDAWTSSKALRFMRSFQKKVGELDANIGFSGLGLATKKKSYCVWCPNPMDVRNVIPVLVRGLLKASLQPTVPVLIRHEIDPLEEFTSETALIAHVQGAVETILRKKVKTALVEKLLQKQNILVVVEDFNKLSTRSQGIVRYAMEGCIANAMIVFGTVPESAQYCKNLYVLKEEGLCYSLSMAV